MSIIYGVTSWMNSCLLLPHLKNFLLLLASLLKLLFNSFLFLASFAGQGGKVVFEDDNVVIKAPANVIKNIVEVVADFGLGNKDFIDIVVLD